MEPVGFAERTRVAREDRETRSRNAVRADWKSSQMGGNGAISSLDRGRTFDPRGPRPFAERGWGNGSGASGATPATPPSFPLKVTKSQIFKEFWGFSYLGGSVMYADFPPLSLRIHPHKHPTPSGHNPPVFIVCSLVSLSSLYPSVFATPFPFFPPPRVVTSPPAARPSRWCSGRTASPASSSTSVPRRRRRRRRCRVPGGR